MGNPINGAGAATNGRANGGGDDDELAAYAAARQSLIHEERSQRYDYAAIQSLSPAGRRAQGIVSSIRDQEVASVWETNKPDVAPPTNNSDGTTTTVVPHPPVPAPAPHLSRYAGMDFQGARKAGLFRSEDLESAAAWRRNQDQLRLWRIVRRMPKGALLHCHFDGSVDARWLIARAVETDAMCVKANMPLVDEATLYADDCQLTFLVLPAADVEAARGKGASIWTANYQPDTWVPFGEARSSFPFPHPYRDVASEVPSYLFPAPAAPTTDARQRANRFDAYVHSLMTLTPSLHQPPHTNSKQAWAKFIKTFHVIGGLLGYEPTLRGYIKQMLKSHARDGIAYTEVRMNFFDEAMVRADGRRDLGHAEWVRIFGEAVDEARAELARDEPDVAFWGARIIYVTVRIVDNERLRWYCDDCIDLKRRFPDLIVGFDLVGHEDPGVPLKAYIPELLRFRRRVAEQGLPTIPFVFHAGETLSDGGPADCNLYDALLLDTRRLGHALSLARHPHLVSLVKERDVAVECCPISNQVLGYASSVASHPSLLALLNDNVALTLSSDDPSIFENFGLSYDFYQLLVSSDATSLASLGVIARRSIRYTLADEHQRQKWELDFDRQWSAFVDWVVGEFGGGGGDGDALPN
ncbi:uncharacterized protein PFL1_03893 [Pseudozyma flocculosa PF-1]|uniref:Related to adenosine deaminase n=2 Tax=Pseudozyma flocculosa TaxID=84751 RepID=A0A5C3EZD9_9BASI|nr:uncharacterized protein PFL1_03893 [Pseudozyma flocculosa PF-1]EPQ28590.1 hypothetical protein PFL1_03893 [Pseudozyma flocculosa PF-1]SPO36529.1 related to adenosine deaminase [Pseudozyma flocculosa]